MSTWENTLNLARFVSSNIPHGNQVTPVKKRNAIELWEYHCNIEPAINCRLHSILFNELLLSVGINNRFISCMPADTTDEDCHVVNVIWLPKCKKWAMIDTDKGIYVTNQQGLPLSLEDMRRNKINEVPMQYYSLKGEDIDSSYYPHYMSKNLYWFVCWEATGYDVEADNPNLRSRCLLLIPPGYKGYKKRYAEGTCTSDADKFWQFPINLSEAN